jgi:hypothetical protein
MKAYGGANVQIHVLLTSIPVGGEWLASCPGRFTPGERAPGTHWMGGWVGPKTGLDAVEKSSRKPRIFINEFCFSERYKKEVFRP